MEAYDLTQPSINLKIDVHSHIIPGVDDGARDFVESLELIKTAYDQGIRVIYATPHYSRQRDNTEVKAAYDQLLTELSKELPDIASQISIILGHELVYHTELAARLREGQAFTMGESNCVLIEFQPDTPYRDMYQQLRELSNSGYRPIVAHMERYDALKDTDNIDELKHMGCLMQMNFDSLVGDEVLGTKALFGGRFNREIRRRRQVVQDGYIDMFGTDMHRRDFRPPDITEAVRWLKDKGIATDET